MPNSKIGAPDISSIGSASFRAMHVQIDPLPHIFKDELGLKLVSPDGIINMPPGMTPESTKRIRASIVGRARFIEDFVLEQSASHIYQYVILGAGLDTFAQRQQELLSSLIVFEVDKPDPQIWKKERLIELGFSITKNLKFVPVDFEAGKSWWDELIGQGFDPNQKALISYNGVSMYITKETIYTTLKQCASIISGSKLVMSFALPIELQEEYEKIQLKKIQENIRTDKTVTSTTFRPDEILTLAQKAGFKKVEHITSSDLGRKYFLDRSDGLWPSSYQDIIVAST